MRKATSYLFMAMLFASLIFTQSASGQCGFEGFSQGGTQVPWFIPPALAGQDGDPQTFEPAKIYLGKNTGEIDLYHFDVLSLSTVYQQTYSPGEELPADIAKIIHIAVPAPDFVIALAAKSVGSSYKYVMVRSDDGGENWSEVDDPAFSQFRPLLDSLVGSRLYTGNYWRAPLLETTWLDDGVHGWLWGRSAVLRTTDAGMSWETIMTASNTFTNEVNHPDHEAIWDIAFKSADSGVVAYGAKIGWRAKYTTDGGDNWWNSTQGTTEQSVDMVWTGSEYRWLRADAFDFDGNNLRVYRANNEIGKDWLQLAENVGIPDSGGLMTEWIWPGHNVGFMIYRQGRIFMTEDGGKNWNLVQDKLDPSVYPTVLWGDGVDIRPHRGYGQKSIFVKDEDGFNYIIQALTDTCNGRIRDGRLYTFEIQQFASVDDVHGHFVDASTLHVSPNPADDELRIAFEVARSSDIRLRLVNADGVTVWSQENNGMSSGAHEITTSIAGIPSGAYRLLVMSDRGRYSKPVVVQR